MSYLQWTRKTTSPHWDRRMEDQRKYFSKKSKWIVSDMFKNIEGKLTLLIVFRLDFYSRYVGN